MKILIFFLIFNIYSQEITQHQEVDPNEPVVVEPKVGDPNENLPPRFRPEDGASVYEPTVEEPKESLPGDVVEPAVEEPQVDYPNAEYPGESLPHESLPDDISEPDEF
jgi:hypothetical protein